VEVCSVALVCNRFVLRDLWLVGMNLTCRIVLSSSLLLLIDTRPLVVCGNEPYM
jgi:hypothetical protein